MVTLDTLRGDKRQDILRIAGEHGARNLRVFGSVARGDASSASDLDLLVEWDSGRSLLDHSRLVLELQSLLGTPVEIGTERSLHWYVRDKILNEAVPL